ncbi:MAG: ABC-F family ATP-binding cassette domain-containing protein [Chloroflexota bacterium]|nr:ABC-F family ATP-binding cassette domain-containing protein [Chloroflexota bacterium]
MSILSAERLTKYYGAQDVFAGLDFSIARGDKIALVGPNGAGKTSLLEIIVGVAMPDGGKVHRASGLRMGYLPQQAEFPSEQTLYQEMVDVFHHVQKQERALQDLAQQIGADPDSQRLVERYARAERRFEQAGGYRYKVKIERVLTGLGFTEAMYDWPIAVLSGGQVTRALLAKLLLRAPELLVLDEPTNYLDLEALEWLESYLIEWPHSLLLVSHDRYLLDKVVSRVWELNHGRLEFYRGNYSRYVQQRRERHERWRREYEEQQEFITKTEAFVRRYKAGQRSKEARGREKRLEHLERIEPPPSPRQMSLHLTTSLRSGDNVLRSEGATIGYASKPGESELQNVSEAHALFNTGEFLIRRGDRVALLGSNGSGKTTFLRTILGQLPPLSGEIEIGASVRIGYLPQGDEWLDEKAPVLQQILNASDLTMGEARSLLGRFLFSGDNVFKETGALSGGEFARLSLALLSLDEPNFLLLDEPTTHLDVESQEILQAVLQDFEGTILFVSHDRYLIDALATHVWSIRDGEMVKVEGNYSDWVQERRRLDRLEEASEQERRSDRDREAARRERARQQESERLASLEEEIHRCERRLEEIQHLIDVASAEQDMKRIHALSLEYGGMHSRLAECMEDWERLAQVVTEGA